jgi:hypothetical protein
LVAGVSVVVIAAVARCFVDVVVAILLLSLFESYAELRIFRCKEKQNF